MRLPLDPTQQHCTNRFLLASDRVHVPASLERPDLLTVVGDGRFLVLQLIPYQVSAFSTCCAELERTLSESLEAVACLDDCERP